jgi:hypothetical protein
MPDLTMNASDWENIARCAAERSQAAYQEAMKTCEGFPLVWRELDTCLMAEKMASQLKRSNA